MKRTAYCRIQKHRSFNKSDSHDEHLEAYNKVIVKLDWVRWAEQTYFELGVIIHENGDYSNVWHKPGD